MPASAAVSRSAVPLSIIVPVLDEAAGIAVALAPLQPLRRAGVEVIVVDGGSRDTTPTLAAPLADRVLDAPRGRGSQMNAGAAQARGDILLFLHADTRLPDTALAAIAEAVAAGACWGRFDVTIAGRIAGLGMVAAMMNLRSRLTGIATGDQALFVTRAAFEQAGGFPDISLMEDIVLSRRLRRIARPACLYERVVTSGRRWEKHGLVRTILAMWRLRLRFFLGADPRALALEYGYAPREASSGGIAIAILAKAPVAGLAKTRLIPRLGAAGAAALQAALLRRAVATAQAAALGPVTLWCAPDCSHPDFAALAGAASLPLAVQPAGDLGERMHAAVCASPAGVAGTLVIGTDCPALTPELLRAAAAALSDNEATLIPAEDGGYVLIGLRKPEPRAFADIAWSTPSVAAQTRERFNELGWRWHESAPLWDVDHAADFERLQRHDPALAAAALPPPGAHAA